MTHCRWKSPSLRIRSWRRIGVDSTMIAITCWSHDWDREAPCQGRGCVSGEKMTNQVDVITKPAAGMEDLWAVYDAHYSEIGQAALSAVEAVPELYEVVKALQARTDPATAVKRSETNRRALKTGMLTGEWTDYFDEIRETGGVYARAGLEFSVWSVVFTGFRSAFIALLRDYCDGDIARFSAAVDALGTFTDKTISAIGDEYLRARQEIINRQQEAIRALATPVLKV